MVRIPCAVLMFAFALCSQGALAAEAVAPAQAPVQAPAQAPAQAQAPGILFDDTSGPALEEDKAVAALLASKYPNLKVRRLGRVQVNGAALFEFQASGGQGDQDKVGGYTDKSVSFVLVGGELVTDRDGKPVNITRERAVESVTRLLRALPIDEAIKMTYGKGERLLRVFADPDCPACRDLEKKLDGAGEDLNATVAVYPYPLSIHPFAAERTRYILCTATPATAWHDWALAPGTTPEDWSKFAAAHPSNEGCSASADEVIQHVRAAATYFQFAETPTIIFPDGTVMVGSPDLATLVKGLGGDFSGIPRK